MLALVAKYPVELLYFVASSLYDADILMAYGCSGNVDCQ